jgi:hypothetical protein
MAKQAVILTFAVDGEDGIGEEQFDALLALEQAIRERLTAVVPEAQHDGHEIPIEGAGDARIFIYGPSADAIANAVAPIVRTYWPKGRVTLSCYPDESPANGTTQEVLAVQ